MNISQSPTRQGDAKMPGIHVVMGRDDGHLGFQAFEQQGAANHPRASCRFS